MREALPKMGKTYVVDESQKNMLPLLNLGAGEGMVKK